MWLIDHQMNMAISNTFGTYYVRLPLNKSARIVNGNALRLDWNAEGDFDFILGNPPFVGVAMRTDEQREDMKNAFLNSSDVLGKLDYVSAWYKKAVEYMKVRKRTQSAFVSTNSICQGEQVVLLWQPLISHGLKINFAHRTFEWVSDSRGKAAVHCVIVGFALFDSETKKIFSTRN
jgi:methylase of polypeptide subunit release factors